MTVTTTTPNVAYPDLRNDDFVYKALLGHGMFTDKLPPCFTSENYFMYVNSKMPPIKAVNHGFVDYHSTNHTSVLRLLAIPHPEAYWQMCKVIKDNWQSINEHIGKPSVKFNYCHVRKHKDSDSIFQMNSFGYDKWKKEENTIDYMIGCRYVVQADISKCFPSMYSHSLSWAINGIDWSKIHQCGLTNKKKQKGQNCRKNGNAPCPNDYYDLWANDLDYYSRAVKDGETNGFLVGPHASNILSEIILSKIDCELQQEGLMNTIRYIDDYTYYAKDENDAKKFLRILTISLKKYNLELNSRKTKIIPIKEYTDIDWITVLNQFGFPNIGEIGFTTINAYINYALKLCNKENQDTPLKYAIKVIANKQLSTRAKRLYLKKVLQIAFQKPYLLPLFDEYVFVFNNDDDYAIKTFLQVMIKKGLDEVLTDALSFSFYFLIEHDIDIDICESDIRKLMAINDCVSILLLYKYLEKKGENLRIFKNKLDEIINLPEREQDKFWLFSYEASPKSKLKGFLKELKENNISFISL